MTKVVSIFDRADSRLWACPGCGCVVTGWLKRNAVRDLPCECDKFMHSEYALLESEDSYRDWLALQTRNRDE